MARPKPEVQLVPALLRFHPDTLKRIDELRGAVDRSRWITMQLATVLTEALPSPDRWSEPGPGFSPPLPRGAKVKATPKPKDRPGAAKVAKGATSARTSGKVVKGWDKDGNEIY